jgi:hypothetical protein
LHTGFDLFSCYRGGVMSLDAPFLLTALGLVAAAVVAGQRAVRFGLELRDLHSLMMRARPGVS